MQVITIHQTHGFAAETWTGSQGSQSTTLDRISGDHKLSRTLELVVLRNWEQYSQISSDRRIFLTTELLSHKVLEASSTVFLFWAQQLIAVMKVFVALSET